MAVKIAVDGCAFLVDETTGAVVGLKQRDGTEVFFALSVSQPGAAVTTAPPVLPQGRLTLTTAVPVTTADVIGATTIYYTPHRGSLIPLYDGVGFSLRAFSELSNATAQSATGKAGPAAVAAGGNYDLFVWDDNGTLRLTRGPVWTNDTTRAAGITLTNGVYLNTAAITNGPAALRGTYVGTVGADSSSQINDSLAKRNVWNCYNRADRPMQVFETTDTWNYTTATIRQANGSTANQLEYICGIAEDSVWAEVLVDVYNDNAAGVLFAVGVGVDSSTVFSGLHPMAQNPAASRRTQARGKYAGMPGLGRHTLKWLEYSGAGTGTTTWGGDNGAATYQSGITGSVLA